AVTAMADPMRAQEVTLKDGRRVVIRPSRLRDAESLLRNVNLIGREEVYILLDQVSPNLDEERRWLGTFDGVRAVLLVADAAGEAIGSAPCAHPRRIRRRDPHGDVVARLRPLDVRTLDLSEHDGYHRGGFPMARKSKRAAKSEKASARKRTSAARTAPIPRGMRTVTPYLVINGAAKAIEFYKKAFGAKEITRQGMPDGTLMHAMIQIGDSLVMMSDEFPGGDPKSPASAGGTTFNLHVYSKDVDKLWNQAIAAGATASMPLENQFWGERYGKLQDPFGHIWSVAMVVKTREEE